DRDETYPVYAVILNRVHQGDARRWVGRELLGRAHPIVVVRHRISNVHDNALVDEGERVVGEREWTAQLHNPWIRVDSERCSIDHGHGSHARDAVVDDGVNARKPSTQHRVGGNGDEVTGCSGQIDHDGRGKG